MIERCLDPVWQGRILEYIGDQYLRVPFFHMNLKQYGTTNKNVLVWADLENGQLCGAYLRYYDCLHFFTRECNYPVEKMLGMMDAEKPRVVMVLGQIGDLLEPHLKNVYGLERMYAVDLNGVPCDGIHSNAELADEEDLQQIANLMMSDPEYENTYDRIVLYNQLRARFADHFSRFFVIRKDGNIAAMYSTYGETEEMALLSGLLVHPRYRRQGLASDIIRYACEMLRNEKKKCVDFVNTQNTPSLELHKNNGGIVYSTLCKFIKTTEKLREGENYAGIDAGRGHGAANGKIHRSHDEMHD